MLRQQVWALQIIEFVTLLSCLIVAWLSSWVFIKLFFVVCMILESMTWHSQHSWDLSQSPSPHHQQIYWGSSNPAECPDSKESLDELSDPSEDLPPVLQRASRRREAGFCPRQTHRIPIPEGPLPISVSINLLYLPLRHKTWHSCQEWQRKHLSHLQQTWW